MNGLRLHLDGIILIRIDLLNKVRLLRQYVAVVAHELVESILS
jgi:hypothetical protein